MVLSVFIVIGWYCFCRLHFVWLAGCTFWLGHAMFWHVWHVCLLSCLITCVSCCTMVVGLMLHSFKASALLQASERSTKEPNRAHTPQRHRTQGDRSDHHWLCSNSFGSSINNVQSIHERWYRLAQSVQPCDTDCVLQQPLFMLISKRKWNKVRCAHWLRSAERNVYTFGCHSESLCPWRQPRPGLMMSDLLRPTHQGHETSVVQQLKCCQPAVILSCVACCTGATIKVRCSNCASCWLLLTRCPNRRMLSICSLYCQAWGCERSNPLWQWLVCAFEFCIDTSWRYIRPASMHTHASQLCMFFACMPCAKVMNSDQFTSAMAAGMFVNTWCIHANGNQWQEALPNAASRLQSQFILSNF